jgi:dTDP-glucose pyrophosphorylase
MDFKNTLISKECTIVEALNQLNKIRNLSRLILFVHNEQGQIVGSITDGDIRRSIVKDQDLNKQVGEICNTSFLYEDALENSFSNLEKYRKQDIKVLPFLNKNKELVEIVDLDKIKSRLPVECMIMAGGRGKRLSPLTDNTPKPMLLLGDMPIIERNIDRLISFGIKKIYISLKYLGEQIETYFGDGSEKGIHIEYIWENEPLGTAGALKLVAKFNTNHVLLMNSDLLTDVDFESLYLKLLEEDADMVVATTEYKVDIPYAILDTDGHEVKAFKEKPTYRYQSNAGVYILKRELIDMIPSNSFYDITDLMEQLISNGGTLVFDQIVGYWIDIGMPADYIQAQEFIKHIK